MARLEVNKEIVANEKYEYFVTVDAVNELVREGMPFREAYLKIGQQIENKAFVKPAKLEHSHEGSLGNLGMDSLRAELSELTGKNPYKKIEQLLSKLIA